MTPGQDDRSRNLAHTLTTALEVWQFMKPEEVLAMIKRAVAEMDAALNP
jgi:hypothetical protein